MRKGLIAGCSFALVVLIWLLAVLTPPDLALSVFYIVPIALTAWYVGRRTAVATATAGAALWAFAEVLSRPDVSYWIHAWNGLTRWVIFLALGVLTTLLVREREKLRTIDRQREEALNFVAHELRSSVVSIEEGVPSVLRASLDVEQRRTLVLLLRQAHSLKRFAEDVLAVGRLERGKLELTRQPLDLSELAAQAARDSTDPDRIQLVLPTDAVPVDADAGRLRLAVEHLISNALKYSPTGSGVFVRVASADGRAQMDVRDDGIGFAESDRETLFEKYGRVRNMRTVNVLGVGLGLYVTRLLVEAHGGSVNAKSVGPGLGSTFTIVLPIASAEPVRERVVPTQGPAPITG